MKGEGRRLDWDKVVQDYTSGLTYEQVAELHGTSISEIFHILTARNVPRRLGWHKLNRTGKGGMTRTHSIPAGLLRRVGFNPERNLEGRWVVKGDKLLLEVREVK